MKFLLALSVLATTTAFAQYNHGGDKIKCYESAQQGGYGKPAFVFEARNNYPGALGGIDLVYPDHIDLRRDDGCLKTDWDVASGSSMEPGRKFKACLGEGQEIGRLVPVEIEYQEEEDTYYCGRGILQYLGEN